jgi:hypothetical protein
LDLIAGLPGEGKAAVLQSVDRVLEIRPKHLQLGFLKMLNGAPLTKQAGRFGIVASADAPYEVLRTEAMSYDDLLELHRVEDMLEKFYNTGFVRYGIEALVREFSSFSELFSCLAGFWLKRGWFGRQWNRRDLLNTLHPFLLEALPDAAARARCIEALRFDYYMEGNSAQNLPQWLAGPAEEAAEENVEENVEKTAGEGTGSYPQRDKEIWRCRLSAGQDADRRLWSRRTSVSCFRFNVPQCLAWHDSEAGRASEGSLSEMAVSEERLFWYLFLSQRGGCVEAFAWED